MNYNHRKSLITIVVSVLIPFRNSFNQSFSTWTFPSGAPKIGIILGGLKAVLRSKLLKHKVASKKLRSWFRGMKKSHISLFFSQPHFLTFYCVHFLREEKKPGEQRRQKNNVFYQIKKRSHATHDSSAEEKYTKKLYFTLSFFLAFLSFLSFFLFFKQQDFAKIWS